jgi:dolichyl-diphosphooligosaccharide---protein glycosyltransferase
VLTALSYFYMVAAWGGYVFVLNLIGLHAATLVATGRFCTKVYVSYTIFYLLGTIMVIQIPVVGWTPLKSLEQLGPCAVFGGYQVLQLCEVIRKRNRLSRREAWVLRGRAFAACVAVAILLILLLAPRGYFGPISSRVRGLFVQHTKTGNPLVDSVAEHQPASGRAYFQYLHHVCTLAPIGYVVVFFNLSDASSFLIVWGTCAYFFSHKMVRLILLTGPIASILGGIAAGRVVVWCVRQWWESPKPSAPIPSNNINEDDSSAKGTKKSKAGKKAQPQASSFDGLLAFNEITSSVLSTHEGIMFKRMVALLALFVGYMVGVSFMRYAFRLAVDLSHPSIIIKARGKDNQPVKIDDYREAYWWLRDNTAEDSRVCGTSCVALKIVLFERHFTHQRTIVCLPAWWDYGYQITAIANRTTIADGNTWNHEHIALLGKALTTDLDEGYEIVRHLADYVLVWAGGRGDDMAKSPHLARIANSVYRDHCPDDPTCRAFGVLDRQGTPSAMMARSLLYRLHSHKLQPGVEAPDDKFVEVYRSKYGFVRIYKIVGVSEESKAWAADPANRICDAPGSWFCRGQYPPGLSKVLARKMDFQQLEDFNRGPADEEYQKRYFEDLKNPDKAQKKVLEQEKKHRVVEEVEAKGVDDIYNTWEDTDDTTQMWKLISSNSFDELKAWLDEEPKKAFIRSRDGRGPMWWAFEQRNEQVTNLLLKLGVPNTDRDAKGLAPVDLLEGGK